MLTEPKNALLKQYRYLFALNDADFIVTRDAISEVARLAIKKRTGARALRNILESMLLEAMFQAPDDDVATVLVDELAMARSPSSCSPRSTMNNRGRRRRSPTRRSPPRSRVPQLPMPKQCYRSALSSTLCASMGRKRRAEQY